MMGLISSKKGNGFFDSYTVFIVVVIFSVASLVGYIMFSEFTTAFAEDDDVSSTLATQMEEAKDSYKDYMDNLVFFMLIGVWISSLLFNFFIDAHPVFIIISIVLLIILFVVVAMVANGLQDLTNDAEISQYAQDFPKILFIYNHFLEIMIVIAATILIVLYGKET